MPNHDPDSADRVKLSVSEDGAMVILEDGGPPIHIRDLEDLVDAIKGYGFLTEPPDLDNLKEFLD